MKNINKFINTQSGNNELIPKLVNWKELED